MKIRDDVPLPPVNSYDRGGSKYGFNNLEVGQSIEITDGDWRIVYRRVSTVAAYWGKKLGRRFSVRKTKDGVGIWRTE